MQPLLKVENLKKTFRAGLKGKVEALRGVSYSLDAGGIIGLIGPNGAGKSTSIKIILDFFRPDMGTVEVGGHSAGSLPARRLIGYMPEHPAFPVTLTGRQILKYAAGLSDYRPSDLDRRIERVMEQVEIPHAIDQVVRGYSKGMLQRLGLAQAILAEPQLLILDEPMSGLDPLGRACFKDVLRQQTEQGRTVFFSSHILADVQGMCERVVMIHKGEVIADGSVNDILQREERMLGMVEFPDEDWRQNQALVDVLQSVTGWGGQRFVVEAQNLTALLEQIFAAGGEIIRIEVAQESLEDYFVRVVEERRGA